MKPTVDPSAQRTRNRNRTMLLVIAAIFLGSLAVAGVLRFTGWQPSGMKNKGELLQPYGDLRAVVPRLANGERYPWAPATRVWRILLAPPAGCAGDCVEVARQLDLVWQLLGKDADQVHILWVGQPPPGAVRNAALRVLVADEALLSALPRLHDATPAPGQAPVSSARVPVYVVDPNGFVILRYAPGFDPADLRSDLSRLLKLM